MELSIGWGTAPATFKITYPSSPGPPQEPQSQIQTKSYLLSCFQRWKKSWEDISVGWKNLFSVMGNFTERFWNVPPYLHVKQKEHIVCSTVSAAVQPKSTKQLRINTKVQLFMIKIHQLQMLFLRYSVNPLLNKCICSVRQHMKVNWQNF